MIKKVQASVVAILLLILMNTDLFAQQEVMIRDLNTYETPLESLADIGSHPLRGEKVTFDAVIVSYPRNSGLASPNETTGIPGRIHTFVVDVNAIDEGLDGMYMQLVTAGALRTTMESLLQGDIIRVVGELDFFPNPGQFISQFTADDVELIGSVFEEPNTHLQPLLLPTPVVLGEVNIPSATVENRWHADLSKYTKYVHRYVTFEAVEVIDRTDAPSNRPRFVTSDGVGVSYHRDISLRYRNDRPNYGVNPNTGDGLNYNYRRLQEDLDGPFVVPSTGSIVNLSGFLIFDTFDPNGYDESPTMRTFRIAPWDDGVLWIADGIDPDNRLTPEGWPNDLEVLGFAPILDNFIVSPEESVFSDDNVVIQIDVLLPEDDYTMDSVVVEFEAFGFDSDSGTIVTEPMVNSGNTWTFTFDNFEDFTTVNYRIIATVSTPEDIQTSAFQSGSFYVESTSKAAPVIFSPGSGTFQNAVAITLSSATEDAQIFYTIDGSDPDEESTPYTAPLTLTQSATVKAIAFSESLDPSPINSRVYTIEVDAVDVSTLADLRANAQFDGTDFIYSGQAVVTYSRTFRNQRYIMDETGGLQIDDQPGVIVSEYNTGSIMTGLIGTLGQFNQLLRIFPSVDPGASPGTAPIEPITVTLADLDIFEHESRLVRIENVTFVSQGTFTTNTNYNITDPSLEEGETVIFRTSFGEADYIGSETPATPQDIVVLVGNFNGTFQLTARSLADFSPSTNIPNDQLPMEFALAQNYPNPFNPTTNISFTLANVSDVRLTVYDILGRRVATLVNARQQMPGTYNVSFDASRLASGTYIYRLEAGDFISTRKMLLIK